jgi:hypothetical protein
MRVAGGWISALLFRIDQKFRFYNDGLSAEKLRIERTSSGLVVALPGGHGSEWTVGNSITYNQACDYFLTGWWKPYARRKARA